MITASPIALTDAIEVSSYGLRGQVLRSDGFDRLATDDLLGFWNATFVIRASLWLEAVFLHAAATKPDRRDEYPG